MAFLKKNKNWDKPFSEKVARRVSRIPTAELESWIDQTLTELARCLSSYQKSREEVWLDEALYGVEALHAVIDELHKRVRRVPNNLG
jgi:hypothetical protein